MIDSTCAGVSEGLSDSISETMPGDVRRRHARSLVLRRSCGRRVERRRAAVQRREDAGLPSRLAPPGAAISTWMPDAVVDVEVAVARALPVRPTAATVMTPLQFAGRGERGVLVVVAGRDHDAPFAAERVVHRRLDRHVAGLVRAPAAERHVDHARRMRIRRDAGHRAARRPLHRIGDVARRAAAFAEHAHRHDPADPVDAGNADAVVRGGADRAGDVRAVPACCSARG